MNFAESQFQWQPPSIRESWQWDEEQIRDWQLQVLNRQLAAILPTNEFYADKFQSRELQLSNLSEIGQLPFTTKQELVASAADSEDDISAHHSFQPSAYSRMHRTSGTTGKPMVILDTTDDWQRWSWTWQHILEAATVTPEDRVFIAFSFGPFIGFWSAHQACIDRGATVIPGGGLSSLARLEFLRQSSATVLCCTPTYALHLAEVAAAEAFPIEDLNVNRIIVAGEPGGSVDSVRNRIEQAWNAQVVDHSGATEIGPWGFGWPERSGLHIIETSFIAELIPLELPENSERNDAASQLHELVLTSLGRLGAPVFRYKTGDIVSAERPQVGKCRFLWLPQGVVGRTDSMVTIRGINVFPSSVDAIVREIPEISEYRVHVVSKNYLDELSVEIEAPPSAQTKLENAFGMHLGLRVPVSIAPTDSLPRSEGKAKRWLDERSK